MLVWWPCWGVRRVRSMAGLLAGTDTLGVRGKWTQFQEQLLLLRPHPRSSPPSPAHRSPPSPVLSLHAGKLELSHVEGEGCF